MRVHRYCRKRHWPWPTEPQFKAHFKRRFALHSQTVQASIEKFFANVEATRQNRRRGRKELRYPWRDKKYFGVIWKGQAIRRNGRCLVLPMGRGRAPVCVRVPAALPPGQIVQVELGYRRINVTLHREITDVPTRPDVAAMDPGVIHLGVITDGAAALAVVGRGLRSIVQGHNKAKAEVVARRAHCQRHSRRWRRLGRTLGKLARRRENRAHNLLHHAANAVVRYCEERNVGTLVAGAITNISRGKHGKRSRRLNQDVGNTPWGRWYSYLDYKLARIGAVLVQESEAYTTQACPVCSHRYKPAGRVYRCRQCGFGAPRDLVGASNLLNRYLHGGVIVPGALIPHGRPKYLRPAWLKKPAQRRSSPRDARHVARYHPQTDPTSSEAGAHAPLGLNVRPERELPSRERGILVL
ncbi:MAG TPA: transposase [Rhodanobacteraceae bacterium]